MIIFGLMLSLMLLVDSASAQTKSFMLGVHYYPGWKDDQVGAAYDKPWDKIKPYPEREPLLGWYPEGDVSVMTQHLDWMRQYGIDYVVFNWIWGSDNRPYLTHALNAFLQSPAKQGAQFAILWANHTDYSFSREQFESIFRFWAQRYMHRDDYVKIDGKPVVFIFSAEILIGNARRIGIKVSDLFVLADRIFKSAGLSGIQFIGGVGGARGTDFDYSAASGYAGFSAYNYHGTATKRFPHGRQVSRSYEELDQGYRDHWTWMLNNASGYYILPMTSGWDKRPWGGSKDPEHDNSLSTPEEFEAHLIAAKDSMLKYPDKTKRMGVICCWNEFGEGAFIEPTKELGFSYLEKVKKVFGER